jgi:hypothetical protein
MRMRMQKARSSIELCFGSALVAANDGLIAQLVKHKRYDELGTSILVLLGISLSLQVNVVMMHLKCNV